MTTQAQISMRICAFEDLGQRQRQHSLCAVVRALPACKLPTTCPLVTSLACALGCLTHDVACPVHHACGCCKCRCTCCCLWLWHMSAWAHACTVRGICCTTGRPACSRAGCQPLRVGISLLSVSRSRVQSARRQVCFSSGLAACSVTRTLPEHHFSGNDDHGQAPTLTLGGWRPD